MLEAPRSSETAVLSGEAVLRRAPRAGRSGAASRNTAGWILRRIAGVSRLLELISESCEVLGEGHREDVNQQAEFEV